MFAAAERLWPVLTHAVEQRQLLTYGATSTRIKYASRTLAAQVKLPCWLIMLYCYQNDRPPLNALVVSDGPDVPGVGIPMDYYSNPPDAWGRTWDYVAATKWSKLLPPTAEAFEEAKRKLLAGLKPSKAAFEGNAPPSGPWTVVRR